MIIDSSTQNEVLGIDEDQSIEMTIDESDKKVLMMILSQGLYSDSVGSLIRELSTNSLDSIREANKNEPILVKLTKENGKFVFIVSDNGVGLSEERVENVFSKYCASTKRSSAEQLGMFGQLRLLVKVI